MSARSLSKRSTTKRPVRIWRIYAPVLLAALVILAIGVALVVAAYPFEGQQSQQISIIGNTMLMCFVLLPMILCGAIVFLLFAAAGLGIRSLHNSAEGGVQRVGELTSTAAERAASAAESVSRRSIAFNARFAYFERLFAVFDAPQQPKGEKSDEPDPN